MPQITDITPQKREGRFNIFLEGKYAFAITSEILVREGLKIDQILKEEEILQLIKEDEFSRFFDRSLKFLSYRPRSEKELGDWFIRKEVGEKTKELVLEKLKKLNFINDLDFAKWWIEQRINFSNSSKTKLKSELRQKGVNEEIIEDLLKEINETKELEMARKIIIKKERSLKGRDKLEFKKKVTNILGARGFNWSIIKKIVDENSEKE